MPAATDDADKLSRREQRRLQHQGLSRDQLLDAAEEVFGRKGFHEATLKEIAELAEFSVGSVYSFFANKDDLFHQIFRRRGEQFMDGMRAVVGGPGTATEVLHRLLDFEVGFFREHPHFARLTLRYSNTTTLELDGAVDESTARNYEEAVKLQAELFAHGQAAGELRAGDPVVLSGLFSGMVWAYQSLDPAVVAGEIGLAERFPLAVLHEMVDGAFAAPR